MTGFSPLLPRFVAATRLRDERWSALAPRPRSGGLFTGVNQSRGVSLPCRRHFVQGIAAFLNQRRRSHTTPMINKTHGSIMTMTAIKPLILLPSNCPAEAKLLRTGAQNPPPLGDLAAGSKDHTTLVAAVKAAKLEETLKGSGPFTVFAPTNAAFEKLPAGTVESLLKPENMATLGGILTYHVVSGNLDAASVMSAIKAGNGKAVLPTVGGGSLTASIQGGKVVLMDEKGGKATVTATDLKASNGVIHVIDTVLMPK